MEQFIPAEALHISTMLQDELDARGWHLEDVAARMGSESEYPKNLLYLHLIWSVHNVNCHLGDVKPLAKAFGVSHHYIENMDATWRNWMRAKGLKQMEPPDNVAGEVNRYNLPNDTPTIGGE